MRGDLGFLLPTTSRVRVSESRARTEVAVSRPHQRLVWESGLMASQWHATGWL